MRIIYLATKDLKQILQQKKSALFLLIMPLLFTWLMGIIFNQNENHDPRLPVGLVVLDDGVLGPHLRTLLNDSDTIRPLTPDQTDTAFIEEQVHSRLLAAVVVVPNGFSAMALDGTMPQLEVIVDRNTPAGQAADRSIQLASTRLLGAVQVARLSAAAAGHSESDAAWQAFVLSALDEAIQAWLNPRAKVVVRPAGIAASAPKGGTQASSGMMVFFATVGMITPGYILLSERHSRTLARMMTTSMTRAEVIAGHVLAMFIVCLVQVVLLTIFGQFIIGVHYWHAPGLTLLMASALAFWSASFGLLISSLARDENQVVLLVLGSTLVFGLLGGTFFPLELTNQSFATIGHMMPSAWAVDGLQDIVLRGSGLISILPTVGILLFYSTAACGAAILLLRRSLKN
ncbi:MAG: ABC transporter permease [Anaerolineae bacterium]|nr:ABC transporter permease [Anaerolineae bacterium]